MCSIQYARSVRRLPGQLHSFEGGTKAWTPSLYSKDFEQLICGIKCFSRWHKIVGEKIRSRVQNSLCKLWLLTIYWKYNTKDNSVDIESSSWSFLAGFWIIWVNNCQIHCQFHLRFNPKKSLTLPNSSKSLFEIRFFGRLNLNICAWHWKIQ